MFAMVLTAAALFVGTNIDSLITGTVLTAALRLSRSTGAARIWVGQFIALSLLTAVSIGMAAGLRELPAQVFAAIGLIPLGLGTVGIVSAIRTSPGTPHHAGGPAGLFGYVMLGLSSGGDNLAAYAVSFREISQGELLVTLCVFAAGAVLWPAIGSTLAARPIVLRTLSRTERWLVPIVFITVGVLAIVRALTAGG